MMRIMKTNFFDITAGSRSIMIMAAVLVALLWTGAVIYAQTGIPTINLAVSTDKYMPRFDPSASTMLSASSDVVGVNFK